MRSIEHATQEPGHSPQLQHHLRVFRAIVYAMACISGIGGSFLKAKWSFALLAFIPWLAVSAQSATPLTFEVASVRQNTSGPPPFGDPPTSNVPLGPGDAFNPIHGLLRASNFPLLTYIAFAYRMNDAQLDAFRTMAPDWVVADHFNLEARIEDPAATKDQLRLMMRTLLAERFHLALHAQPRETSVYALILARPGLLGPRLQPHAPSQPCPRNFSNAPPTGLAQPQKETVPAGYPTVCGAILGVPATASDRYSFGARDIPIPVLANALTSWGHLGRPVLDQTGLTGNYDFVLDFTPETPPPDAPDSGGPTFIAALEHQLGLKLKPGKGQIQILRLDHIDHLTAN